MTKSKGSKKNYFYMLFAIGLMCLAIVSAAEPFVRTGLNKGTVTNITAVRLGDAFLTSVFNRTTIVSGIGNLSSPSTIVKQRKDIGLIFDDFADAVWVQNTTKLNVKGNFTILAKINVSSNTQDFTQGTIVSIGGIGDLNGSYQLGNSGDALLFGTANSSLSDYGSYTDIPLNLDQINYVACGVNKTNTRWCSANGVLSSMAWTINHPYKELGNNTIIGDTEVNGVDNDFDFGGNIYDVAIVNGTLNASQYNAYRWNDALITPAADLNDSQAPGTDSLALFENGSMIKGSAGNITVSTNGITFTQVYKFPATVNGSSTLWRDSYNTTFYSNWLTGEIFRSANDDLTTWTKVLTMTCDNSTSSIYLFPQGGMTRAPNGYLYAGTYANADPNGQEVCGHIYRSQDDGVTWTLVYNDTAFYPDPLARHVHFVQADPYTGKIYASLGDNEFRRKLIRSDDNGNTWVIVGKDSTYGVSWQPTMIVFTPAYRIIGMDFNPGDEPHSKIWRSSDDVNWQEVFNQDLEYYGFWSFGVRDRNNRTWAGMSTVRNDSAAVVVMTEDDFNTTQIIYQKDANTFNNFAGFAGATNIARDGTFYFGANFIGDSHWKKPTYIPKPQVLAQWKLDENTGTNTTDVASGYVGRLINDTSWINSSGYNTLLPGIDYQVITTTNSGNISLLNAWYNQSQVDINLRSYTTDSMYNYLTGYWAFDGDNSSNSFDYAVDLTSTYQGGLLSNTTTCIYGRCLATSGSGTTYINVPNTKAGNFGQNGTMNIWLKVPKGGGGYFMGRRAGGNDNQYFMFATSDRDISSIFLMQYSTTGSAANDSQIQIPYVFPQNEWTMFTVTKQGNQFTFYKNGENLGTSTLYMNETTNSALTIGQTQGAGFNGSLDELMFFNITLREEQIRNIFTNNSQRFQEYNYRNVSYTINASNRLYVSVPFLTLINTTQSVSLNVSSGTNVSITASDTEFIYASNINNTFVLADSSTNITLNYTIRSIDRFLSPVLSLTENYFAFNFEAPVDNSGLDDLSSSLFKILIGMIALAVLGFFLIGLMMHVKNNFSTLSAMQFVEFSVLGLIVLVLMIVLMNYIASLL